MDRGYYREPSSTPGGAMGWILYGQVPLFNAFGIAVKAHSSLIIYVIITLLVGFDRSMTFQDRATSATVIFLIVLLHEFGHCFAARWVGGSADEIVMHPLGGLALTAPPPRPVPHLITTIGGPLVNVVICLIAGAIVWRAYGWLPWNPVSVRAPSPYSNWADIARYAYWIYTVSWMILLFNLLPIFPLDGGRMVQSILWMFTGYYRSMMISCTVGIFGAAAAGVYALAFGRIGLFVLAGFGAYYCYQLRRSLQYAGPGEMADQTDYSAAYDINAGRPKMKSRRAIHKAAQRAKKLQQQEEAERERIDAILAKVSAHGMNSLNWFEKRALRKATEHQRQRDQELLKSRGG